jgi:hypothetical protein
VLEIKDVLFRGREDLVYRLRVGALPFVTHIYPLGGQRDTDAQVELNGVNLPAATTSFAIPGDAPPLKHVQVQAGGLTSNTLPFAVGGNPEIQEAEPNDAAEKAQQISIPVTINGRIQQDGDADYFAFPAKAKDVVVVDAWARRLESPLDPIITLLNAKGGRLAENDDTVDESQGLITHHADSFLTYTVRTDGDYVVRIGDVQGLGGEEYAYRLRVGPPQADFDLRLFPANLRVAQGSSSRAKIKAYRRDGFNGEIRVTAAGLLPGFVISDAVLGTGQNEMLLTITAPPDAPLGILSPTFTGTARVGEEEIVRQVVPAEDLMQAFYYRHDVPTDELLLAVVKPISLSLSTDSPPTHVHEVAQGGQVSLKVTVSRDGLKNALAQAEAAKTTADEAAAKMKAEAAEAGKLYNAAEKAARDALSAVTTTRTAAARAASVQTSKAAAANSKRQQATAAKKKLDDLTRKQPKPAEAELAAAKTAYEAAEKAAQQAEAAATAAQEEADNARAAQAAAAKDAPEKRKLADAAKAKRDALAARDKAAAAKAAEAAKRVAAVKQAEKGNISLKTETPPRGITVKAASIPAGKKEATITVSVTNQAPVGFRHNVVLTANLKAGQDTFTGTVPAIPLKVVAPPPKK